MTTLVIPAYNEEKRIARTLESYLHYFHDDLKILVVLNGCTDDTEGVMRRFEEKFPGRITHITIVKGGKGLAIREGFARADGDLIGFVDADGATAPAEFSKLVGNLHGVDGVIASRWMEESQVSERSSSRAVISKAFVLFVKLLFFLPYQDTQCGAKIFRRSVIEAVLPHLSVSNMAFDVELLWLIKKCGFTVREVPTAWRDQSSSAFLGSPAKLMASSAKMLITLFSLRIRFFFIHNVCNKNEKMSS